MTYHEYERAQIDLACIDTYGRGDFDAYSRCIRWKYTGYAVRATITDSFRLFGSMPFEDRERQTREERFPELARRAA